MNVFKILYYILIFYIIIIFIIFIKKQTIHQIKCNQIYNQKEIYTKQYILYNFLSNDECNKIINESENYSKKYGWTKDRHDEYPTTDNEITSKWNCYQYLFKKINQDLFPIYNKFYNINSLKLKISELFVAKYDGNQEKSQKSLDAHEDGSEFSFIIALNNDYSGGGTRFIKDNKVVKLKKGDIVIFCGQTRHEGLKVTSGVRYILTGFLKYGKCFQQFNK